MNRMTGQLMRMAGLFIEMLGILALALRTRTGPDGVPLPGHFPERPVWVVVALGFILWLAGTLIIYWPRRSDRNAISNADIDP